MDHQLPGDALGPKAVAALQGAHPQSEARDTGLHQPEWRAKVMGAGAVAGEQPERMGETRVFILPSPSPLAANHWDIKPWRDLAKAVKNLP